MANSTTTSSGLSLYGEGGDAETEAAFMQFLASYGKTYASKSHLSSRYKTFVANFNAIKEHNAKKLDYEMGVNQFSDLTVDEFSQIYLKDGLAMPTEEERTRQLTSRPSLQASKKAGLPEKVDWREAGKMTTP